MHIPRITCKLISSFCHKLQSSFLRVGIYFPLVETPSPSWNSFPSRRDPFSKLDSFLLVETPSTRLKIVSSDRRLTPCPSLVPYRRSRIIRALSRAIVARFNFSVSEIPSSSGQQSAAISLVESPVRSWIPKSRNLWLLYLLTSPT